MLAVAGVVAVLLLALVWVVFLRRPWPFKVLQRRGDHTSAKLPPSGADLEERKRDFTRIVAPSSRPGLFVVTPTVAMPSPWTSTAHGVAGDVSRETADAVFAEFAEWLAREAKNPTAQLAERVVALVAVSEGFSFAMKNKFPPMFPQSKFVLVLGSKGEVRVMWLAFVTSETKANLHSTPFVVKLVTEDLNTSRAVGEAAKSGVSMDYVVVNTREKDLGDYVQKCQVAALSRAAVEGSWEDVLGSV